LFCNSGLVDPFAMPANRKTRGEMVNYESPNWAPLEKLVGLELAELFMWMFEVELRNRTRLHAYKHHITRSYLHIAMNGRCFNYVGEGYYRQVSQYHAVTAVFGVWDEEGFGLRQLNPRQRAALDFTRENASFELLEPGQRSPLDPDFGGAADDGLVDSTEPALALVRPKAAPSGGSPEPPASPDGTVQSYGHGDGHVKAV
jgi:hypothetical protein